MRELSEKLTRTVHTAERILRQVSEPASGKPALKGGWSRKQVIGHLIDSASNNHQRFVRAALQGSLEFPHCDQDGCVRAQAPQDAPWPLLVTLWTNYNHRTDEIVRAKQQWRSHKTPHHVTFAFIESGTTRYVNLIFKRPTMSQKETKRGELL